VQDSLWAMRVMAIHQVLRPSNAEISST
jgi:hypothetical protein